MDIPIIILAAGASRRMRGRDKLMEIVDGMPLITRQARMARRVTRGPVIVTLPVAPHARYDALKDVKVSLQPIELAKNGLSESLKGGIAALPMNTKAAMLLLADLPDLQEDDLTAVAEAAVSERNALIWRATTRDGAPGHPIVVSASLFADLSQTTGDTGGADVIKRHRDQTVFVPLPGNRALCDLDTPEDWNAWRKKQLTRTKP